ncbi:ParB/RepB/Spo0J family partition protein [Streptomyces lushanensis]|uniref:ParB/RepB/Spo0J family partition protein n=1 Tax=Streptomyces lushanensis TaxID=1434255 RepID=UPI001B7FF6C1|nr:ParB N-terminal domain-containing protein [Streptomyces lushanensis]
MLACALGEFPPIVVHRATMRVVDGLHRVRAAELRKQEFITARMFEGDEVEAFVLAVQANLAGGLPLSVADRKAAAARVIASHPQWSDRLTASVTGLSAKTVAEVRRRHPAETTRRPDSRIGKDGRVRPTDAVEKRRLASELILRNPELSLRQIARAVGISPETARSVRARLLRQEDPAEREPGEGRWTAEPPPLSLPLPSTLPPPPTLQPPPVLPDPTSTSISVSADARRDPGPEQELTDRSTEVQRLRTDPSLRYSENGRTLLRLMEAHAMSSEKWATLANSVPAHRRRAIANAAMEYAKGWRVVAEQLARNAPHSA